MQLIGKFNFAITELELIDSSQFDSERSFLTFEMTFANKQINVHELKDEKDREGQ